MKISEKKKMFRDMYKIRRFEETVSKLFEEGEISGFLHLYLGQEACAVGVCSALHTDDYITSTHRGHGHLIAKGADLNLVMAEMYAKVTGYCKGKGSSMHIASPELGILGANGIVGAGIPIAIGGAMTSKLKHDNKKVSVSFFGDGASNQGTFHESINIASAFKLPAVFVCENNLYGVGTKQTTVRNVEDIADRAVAYGIPGVVVDGNDADAVYEATKQAVERAKCGEGPTLIECKTYRWHTHFEGEPDTYRTQEEKDYWFSIEPVGRYEEKLLELGVKKSEIKKIKQEVEDELLESIEFARNSDVPEVESALTDVYAD